MPSATCNVNLIVIGITCAVAVAITVSAALTFAIITNSSGSSKPSLSARTIATISTYHPWGRNLHVHVLIGHSCQ